MSTNPPFTDNNRTDDVQRVEVHRSGQPTDRRVRRVRRKLMFTGAGAIFVLICVLVVLLGLFIFLLPYLLIAAAVLLVVGWVRSFLGQR